MSVLQALPMAGPNNEGTRTEASLQTRWSLIGRLKDWGDQQSWQEFFDTYWKLIYTVALKAGLSDAEAHEVVQETVISVAKKMPEFKADPAAGSFKSWLLTLTRWRIIDQAMKRQGKPAPNPDGGQECLPNPHNAMSGLQHGDDSARTSTVDRIPDPGLDLEAVLKEEWEKNLLAPAAERGKGPGDPEQFQLF